MSNRRKYANLTVRYRFPIRSTDVRQFLQMKVYTYRHIFSRLLVLICLIETICFQLQVEIYQTPQLYHRLQVNMKATKKALRPMNVLGKGFGKTTIIPKRLSNALTLTPPGQVRKIEGHYKRLLERQSELFNQLIAKETTVVNDIYARSEISKKAFFIGRIAYTSSENIEDVIKSLEILLLEYAKTLQPIELGSLLLLSYPQLFYAPSYSNSLVQQSTVNLTRYYHFNKHSTFLAYDHIGFQPSLPFEAKKSIASLSHHDNHPITRNEPIVYDSELYCDDTGIIWSSEEIHAFLSQPQPIYERKGRKDIHGLMDRFLDFPSMLDNASDSDKMAGSEELDDE